MSRKYIKGQVVGLSTQNFRFKAGLKLVPCFIPIKIEKHIGNQAYKITLPPKFTQKHNVFLINLLKPWIASDLDNLPLPNLEDKQEIWKVEDIETHNNMTKGRKYLVK